MIFCIILAFWTVVWKYVILLADWSNLPQVNASLHHEVPKNTTLKNWALFHNFLTGWSEAKCYSVLHEPPAKVPAVGGQMLLHKN